MTKKIALITFIANEYEGTLQSPSFHQSGSHSLPVCHNKVICNIKKTEH